MENTQHDNNISFLRGGGEMGKLTREKDWRKTSLGEPSLWPQSLRTTLNIILNSKFPMFLFWGKDLICFYNDAYLPSLGKNGKHPSILGMKAEEGWTEIWHIIKPWIDQVLKGGEAVWFENQLIPIYRNGQIEEVYWTFSYSPVNDETGSPSGVIVTCHETTHQVITLKSLVESEERFRAMADNIPNLAWMAKADGWIYWYNKKWYEYTGTTPEQMEGWGWQSVHDTALLPSVLKKWKETIATGEEFEMIFPLKGADGKFRQFLTLVSPLKDSEGNIYQWFGTNTDITNQKEIEDALKASDERFRDTVRQAPVGITILRGKDYLVEMANDAYLQLVNKTETDFVGKPLFDSLPEVKETVHSILDSVLNTGVPYYGDEVAVPINRYGKEEVGYFDFLYYPLKEKDGKISGIIVTVNEVSEKVHARKKIEENESHYHNLISSSPSAIGILHGEEMIISIANEAILKIWGKGKEIIGQSYFEALPELAEQGYREIFTQVYKTGMPFNAAETLVEILQNGENILKYYNFLLFAQRNINNEIDGIGIIATDVTSQTLLNKKIKESEKRFRLLADSMPQFIWTADAEGNLNYFNQSVFKYSGLSLERINKQGWIMIVHPDDRERNIEAWMNAIQTGKEFLFEHRFRKHTGEYRWQLSRAIPQKDEEGNIQSWVGTSTDIQDQKMFTAELEKQVQERTKALEENNVELQKINKELQSFAYISSHDLQEPLRKIQTFVTRILEKEINNLSEKGKDYFKRILIAAKRMQTLIQDLLAYSRTNTINRKFEKVDLNKIIEDVKEELKEELKEKNATIEANELCHVHIIPFQFHQLMVNIISNSLKFSKPHTPPHIKIKSTVSSGVSFNKEKLAPHIKYCHIHFSDNGIGFEQQFSEKIFELFQRLHTNQEYRGTGLGLAIVKKIVDNHKGIIIATGEVNKGANFDIYIPLN